MATTLLVVGAMASAGVAAFALAPAALDGLEAQRRKGEVRRRLQFGSGDDLASRDAGRREGLPLRLARDIVPMLPLESSWAVRKLMGIKKVEAMAATLAEQLNAKHIACTPARALVAFMGCALLAALLAFALMQSAAAAIVVGGGVVFALTAWLGRIPPKREQQMRSQVPDALRAIDSALAAGMSSAGAFAYAAECVQQPLAGELAQVKWDMQTGQGFQGALERLERRVGVPELLFVVVAMEVQHKSGGSLRRIIAVANDAVREAYDLERSLEVQTAQARLSARVVGAMPFALLAMLVIVSPGYLESFMGSSLGVAMLAVAATLDIAGLLIIKSVMDVEV